MLGYVAVNWHILADGSDRAGIADLALRSTKYGRRLRGGEWAGSHLRELRALDRPCPSGRGRLITGTAACQCRCRHEHQDMCRRCEWHMDVTVLAMLAVLAVKCRYM